MRTDTYYCDRPAPQNPEKTCKEYGANAAWTNKIKDTSTWNCWYRRVYQSFQMKAKRNPDNLQFKKDFDEFRKKAKQWKSDVKQNIKTSEEFIEWIKQFKQEKRRN